MERTNSPTSVEGKPTKEVLALTYTDVLFIRSVSDTTFFFRNHLQAAADHSLMNTDL
jgi:hypothetical protein